MHNHHRTNDVHFYRLEDPQDHRFWRGRPRLSRKQESRLLRDGAGFVDPVSFNWWQGRRLADVVWSSWLGPILVSNRLIGLLNEHGVTGWATYPVAPKGFGGDNLDDYHFRGYQGLTITGRCDLVDLRRSEPSAEVDPAGDPLAFRGYPVDVQSWDGSDVFIPEHGFAFPLVTDRVRKLLEQAEVANVQFTATADVQIDPLVATGVRTVDLPEYLTYDTVVEHLLEVAPYLNGYIQRGLPEFAGEPVPPTIVFENIVARYLDGRLGRHQSTNQIDRLWHFLGELSTNHDSRIRSLVGFTWDSMQRSPEVERVLARHPQFGHMEEKLRIATAKMTCMNNSQQGSRFTARPLPAIMEQTGSMPGKTAATTADRLNGKRVFSFGPSLANDLLTSRGHLPIQAVRQFEDGTAVPDRPVIVHYDSGRMPGDAIWSRWGWEPGPPFLHRHLVQVLEHQGFSGWSTYPAEVYGPDGVLMEGYAGLVITGRLVPVSTLANARRRSRGKASIGSAHNQKPIHWDGSDVFLVVNYGNPRMVTEDVRTAFEEVDVRSIWFREVELSSMR